MSSLEPKRHEPTKHIPRPSQEGLKERPFSAEPAEGRPEAGSYEKGTAADLKAQEAAAAILRTTEEAEAGGESAKPVAELMDETARAAAEGKLAHPEQFGDNYPAVERMLRAAFEKRDKM